MSEFDCNHDYFGDLRDSELFKKDDNEFPLLRGLQRLAHSHRGGVKFVESKVNHTPTLDSPIASVTVEYGFADGTMFSGSACATMKAHKAPFNLHLVALAESKAESRALRRAFNITKVAYEEIGDASGEVIGEPDIGPIQPHQIEAIKNIAKRRKISQAEILKAIGRGDIADITMLSSAEGRNALDKVNKIKVKK